MSQTRTHVLFLLIIPSMYVHVAVNIPHFSGAFDYHLPAELEGAVAPGCLVSVPLRNQIVQGIVLGLSEHTELLETRPVLALLEEQPVLNPAQLELAQWLSEQTLSPLPACLDLMIPPGLSKQADTLFRPNPAPYTEDKAELSQLQQRMVDLMDKRGELRGRQIAAAFSHQHWKPAAQALVRRGRWLAKPVLPSPSVRPKMVRTVQLVVSPQVVEERFDSLGRAGALKRRQAALQALLNEPWPMEVSWVYAKSGANLSDLQRLTEDGLVRLGEGEVWRNPLDNLNIQSTAPHVLTPEQREVLGQIVPALAAAAADKPSLPFLLHGVTGSGKTEIYLQAVEETLRRGRQALVLVPEISLTPQTLRRFAGRFPGQVGIVHSKLSPGERYDTWRRARDGKLPVIVGPRSALFAPLDHLGLIVIDECHDDSYYQTQIQPSYHAVETAIAYARMTHSALVLGSATPDIVQMHRAEREGWPVLKLPLRILAHAKTIREDAGLARRGPAEPAGDPAERSLPLPKVHIADMREELKAGNRSMFSQALQKQLGCVLDAGQQAILFLNRRGSATYVFCRQCGYTLRCPRCDMPLTYHAPNPSTLQGRAPAGQSLRCHSCNYRRQMPVKCPECGSNQIRQYGAGTEKVEKEVQGLFPQARILRWDAETTRRKGSHDLLLSHFTQHRADILVGTQMLAKGLDLPLVTLVGVILADVGLNFPDYKSGERTFQLLTQVAGRAGRSELGGQVILQTFQPDHYVIRAAAQHDYDGFYHQEIENRRKLRYPPFYHLARLECKSLKAKESEETATRMARQIQHWIEQEGFPSSDLIGPVPCFFSRVGGYYRWQIILRSPDPAAILRGRSLGDFQLEIDPPSLL